ncbi:MAG: glycosyltransferase [Candidatus Omnitrophica bacterium]|nr:glycosyltransferase [Candidatus Omnitrophota bacterium]
MTKYYYFLANFPCYSETFILNELVELKRRGDSPRIFALKKPKEPVTHEEAKPFLNDTVYALSVLNPAVFVAQVYFIFRAPFAYFGILFDILKSYNGRIEILLGNILVFLKAAYFAFLRRKEEVTHIHAHFANYPALAALAVSRLRNIPFTFTCHAHDIFYDTAMLDIKVRRSKACFAISRFNRDYILGKFPCITPEKIKVLHCGIAPEKFPFLPYRRIADKMRLISVGRLVPTKGFDDLIRACRVLKDNGVRFSCDIAGHGPQEDDLDNLVVSLGLKEDVISHGALNSRDLIELYKKSDVLVLAAKKTNSRDVLDGIPVVLMEAMSMGLVVISTRVSGIPELIDDGINGILVNEGDYRSLAEAIIKLTRGQCDIKSLREAARDKINKEFSIARQVDELRRYFPL